MAPPKLRVAYVIDELGHGGAQRQLLRITQCLADQVHAHVVCLSAVTEPYASRLRSSGVEVTVVPRRSAFDLTRLRGLLRVAASGGFDVVHAFLDSSNVYAFLAARRLRVPVVLSMRSDRLHMTGARARVLRWMLRRADAVTVNSEAGRDFLVVRLGAASGRVVVVPNVVALASTPVAPRSGAVIGCVGRLTKVKRFDAVIEALAQVRARIPSARVVLVGDGPERGELEAAARRLGVVSAVEFRGAVDDGAVAMAEFACLVVASTHEGMPNAALEALSLGLPVVALPVGDLPRVVTDGVTGVLARDASPAALADAVVRALTDPQLRASAAREGPLVIRERFSPARARDALLALYRTLAPGRS
jgi:glycosyltransferase involved in cell wall biosynthesis